MERDTVFNICIKCGAQANLLKNRFCSECNFPIVDLTFHCPHCSFKVEDYSETCSDCGKSISFVQEQDIEISEELKELKNQILTNLVNKLSKKTTLSLDKWFPLIDRIIQYYPIVEGIFTNTAVKEIFTFFKLKKEKSVLKQIQAIIQSLERIKITDNVEDYLLDVSALYPLLSSIFLYIWMNHSTKSAMDMMESLSDKKSENQLIQEKLVDLAIRSRTKYAEILKAQQKYLKESKFIDPLILLNELIVFDKVLISTLAIDISPHIEQKAILKEWQGRIHLSLAYILLKPITPLFIQDTELGQIISHDGLIILAEQSMFHLKNNNLRGLIDIYRAFEGFFQNFYGDIEIKFLISFFERLIEISNEISFSPQNLKIEALFHIVIFQVYGVWNIAQRIDISTQPKLLRMIKSLMQKSILVEPLYILEEKILAFITEMMCYCSEDFEWLKVHLKSIINYFDASMHRGIAEKINVGLQNFYNKTHSSKILNLIESYQQNYRLDEELPIIEERLDAGPIIHESIDKKHDFAKAIGQMMPKDQQWIKNNQDKLDKYSIKIEPAEFKGFTLELFDETALYIRTKLKENFGYEHKPDLVIFDRINTGQNHILTIDVESLSKIVNNIQTKESLKHFIDIQFDITRVSVPHIFIFFEDSKENINGFVFEVLETVVSRTMSQVTLNSPNKLRLYGYFKTSNRSITEIDFLYDFLKEIDEGKIRSKLILTVPPFEILSGSFVDNMEDLKFEQEENQVVDRSFFNFDSIPIKTEHEGTHEAVRICSNCSNKNPTYLDICLNCQLIILSDEVVCSQCLGKISEDYTCLKCKEPVFARHPERAQKQLFQKQLPIWAENYTAMHIMDMDRWLWSEDFIVPFFDGEHPDFKQYKSMFEQVKNTAGLHALLGMIMPRIGLKIQYLMMFGHTLDYLLSKNVKSEFINFFNLKGIKDLSEKVIQIVNSIQEEKEKENFHISQCNLFLFLPMLLKFYLDKEQTYQEGNSKDLDKMAGLLSSIGVLVSSMRLVYDDIFSDRANYKKNSAYNLMSYILISELSNAQLKKAPNELENKYIESIKKDLMIEILYEAGFRL